MGWAALEQWGNDVARIEPLAGGVANDVWSVRVKGHLAVGRLGARSDADLAWETGLLQHLDREGLTVPVPIPTTDGRLFADGVVVMTYVEGGPPETEADWRRVADTLRQLHRLTPGWPQRPGWRSSTELLHAETGTKIDLDAMPPEGVARCRAAWARLLGRRTCVVHGDPNNPGNVRMTADRVKIRQAMKSGTRDELGDKQDLRIGGAVESQQFAAAQGRQDPGYRTGEGGELTADPDSRTGLNDTGDPGTLIVTCERGDMRVGREGTVWIYDDNGFRVVRGVSSVHNRG